MMGWGKGNGNVFILHLDSANFRGLLHKLLRLVLQVSHLIFFFKTGHNYLSYIKR